jgi:hypothetical protein
VAVAVGVAERGAVGVRTAVEVGGTAGAGVPEGVGVVPALDAGLAVAVGTPPGVKALLGVAVGPGGAEVGVGVVAAEGTKVGDGVAPVSAAGQMVSDSRCTQRCSTNASWMAAFSERTSKPLEPLPPSQAVSPKINSTHVSQRYRRLSIIASPQNGVDATRTLRKRVSGDASAANSSTS